MRNNVFGDISSLTRYIVDIPTAGTVALYSEYKGERELMAEIPLATWRQIQRPVEAEYNARSKAAKLRVAHFKRGENLLDRLYGRELAVLMWAVERETDEERIYTARINWQTLMPEERWWWYTRANASNMALQAQGASAEETHDRGWCRAIREGLCTVYMR